MIVFPKVHWKIISETPQVQQSPPPLRLANPCCKEPYNGPPGLLITDIPQSIVLLILSFELSHRRILHGVRSTYRAKMTPILPTTCGWRCILSRLCCSDQYHLQVLRTMPDTLDHSLPRQTHAFDQKWGIFFQKKRKSCGAVCVRKIKGGNFKVAVKPISPQTSNDTTPYIIHAGSSVPNTR